MASEMSEGEPMKNDVLYSTITRNLNLQFSRLCNNPTQITINIKTLDKVCFSVYRLIKSDTSLTTHVLDSQLVSYLIDSIVVCVKNHDLEASQRLVSHFGVIMFKSLKTNSSNLSTIVRENEANLLFVTTYLKPIVSGIKKANLCYVEDIIANLEFFDFDTVYPVSCLVITTIFNFINDFDKVSLELGTMLATKIDNESLFLISLDIVEHLESQFEREILLLLEEYVQVYIKIDQLEKKHIGELSDTNLKCIKYIKEITYETFVEKYPYSHYLEMFRESDGCVKGNQLEYLKSSDVNQKLQESFQFILEVLDQGLSQEYLIWNNGSDYLLFHLRSISRKKDDKLRFYYCFNGLNSKVSLGTSVLYLNFILSLSISSLFESLDIPEILLDYFKPLRLPPIFKSKFLPTSYKESSSNSYYTLQLCVIYNLKIMVWILEDEIKSLSHINMYAPGTARYSIIFKLIELSFPSLLTALIIAKRNAESDLTSSIIRNLVKQVFAMIINIEIKGIGNSLIWVSLINFANDVCYSDLRYVAMFYDILGYLASRSQPCLDDPLVRSGLQFFYSTFSPNSSSSFEAWIEYRLGDESVDEGSDMEVFLHDFEYLYRNGTDSLKQNSIMDVTNNDSDVIHSENFLLGAAPAKQNYSTNSARQQSIHVDQFGKV